MPSSTSRTVTALAATAVLTAGLGICATTASAKSDLDIRAAAGTVAPGGTVRISASGATDDFGGAPVLLCLERRTAADTWHRLRCTSAYRLDLDVPAGRHGELAFRARLLAETGPHHWIVGRTSDTVVVRVR